MKTKLRYDLNSCCPICNPHQVMEALSKQYEFTIISAMPQLIADCYIFWIEHEKELSAYWPSFIEKCHTVNQTADRQIHADS